MSNIFDVNTGVFQARHAELSYTFTVNGDPLAGVQKAKYVVYNNRGEVQLELELGSGVSFADSTFTIKITDTNSTNLSGELHHELFYEDAEGNISQVFIGRLRVTKTNGRFTT